MGDAALESAIDDIGRSLVFDRAMTYGWHTGNLPPKWVWWGIVHELRAEAARLTKGTDT